MVDVSNATFKMNTGRPIPALGMGTVDKEADDDSAVDALVYGLQQGYRLLDTASVYKNEHVIGEAIRQSGIPREEIFVTTKLWNTDIRNDRYAEAFEESLDKLGLDYVDLYLVHWPIVEKLVPCWKAMEGFYASGRAKAIGVSNYLPHHLDAILADAEIVPAVNQVEFHPLFQQHPLRDYCEPKGILIQAYKPFIGGRLFGNEKIAELARKYKRSEGQIVLRFLYEQGIASIPKSAHKDRILNNARIFDFEFSAEDSQKMASIDTGKRLGTDPDNFSF